MIQKIKKAIKSMIDEDEEYRQHCALMRGTEGAPAYSPRWNHELLRTILEIIKRIEADK